LTRSAFENRLQWTEDCRPLLGRSGLYQPDPRPRLRIGDHLCGKPRWARRASTRCRRWGGS